MFLSGYQKDTSWDLSVQTGLKRLLYNEALLDPRSLFLRYSYKHLYILQFIVYHSCCHSHIRNDRFYPRLFYSSLFADNRVDLKTAVSPEGGALFLTLSLLLMTIFLPVYFRMGISKALLFSPVAFIISSSAVWAGYKHIYANMQHWLGTPLSVFILLVLFSSLTLLSIFLSIKAYKLKEL